MAQLHHKNIVVVHDIVDEVYADPLGFIHKLGVHGLANASWWFFARSD